MAQAGALFCLKFFLSVCLPLSLSPPFSSSFLALTIASHSLFSYSHSSAVFLLFLLRLDSVPVLQALTQPVVFLDSAVLPRNKRKNSLTSEHCSALPLCLFSLYLISTFILSFFSPSSVRRREQYVLLQRKQGESDSIYYRSVKCSKVGQILSPLLALKLFSPAIIIFVQSSQFQVVKEKKK